MSTRSTFFTAATVEIDQSRYEELVRTELKAKQYKSQLQKLGTFDGIISIIEGDEIAPEKENAEDHIPTID